MTSEPATVVIPCAGWAERLSIPFPKELFPLGPGCVLVDRALALVGPLLPVSRVIVVTRPDKLETARYLARYAARTNLAFVYQTHETGLTGAVRSALPWCSRRIAVLLPDEVVDPVGGEPPVPALFEALDSHPVAFLAAMESDPARLARDGALGLDATDRVVAYADKYPDGHPSLNAIWTGYAVTRDHAPGLLDFMAQYERRLPPPVELERADLFGAPVLRVRAIRDLGTWPEIANHFRLSSDASRVFG